jgi:cytochrome c biogenesis protein CcdA
MKIISFLVEVIAWVRIVLSPTLAAAIVAGIIVYKKQDAQGYAIGLSIVLMGFIIGVVWAVNIWRKQGTTQFLSRVSASPELNKSEE